MEDGEEYKLFRMLEKEISFDVDMCNLRYGTDRAIHCSDMEKTGNMNPTNTAGAAYGTGYCDGQWARDLNWANGKSNSEGWVPDKADPCDNSGTGDMDACCAVMVLWEANEECDLRGGDPLFIAPLIVMEETSAAVQAVVS